MYRLPADAAGNRRVAVDVGLRQKEGCRGLRRARQNHDTARQGPGTAPTHLEVYLKSQAILLGTPSAEGR